MVDNRDVQIKSIPVLSFRNLDELRKFNVNY